MRIACASAWWIPAMAPHRCRSFVVRRMRAPVLSACSRRPALSFLARTSRSGSAPSAASRAAACCARRPSCSFRKITTASWSCRPTRRSASPIREWAQLGDPLIEINLTPNRQDCTGVHGIARDLSAADMGKFKDPGIKQIKGEFPCPVKVTVEDANIVPGLCAAAGARRQERPLPGMAAKAPDLDRAATDQCAGRYHQLHDL